MSETKTVVIDMDGVLLDVHPLLEKLLCEKGYKFSMQNVLTYDFNKSLKNPPASLVSLGFGKKTNYLGIKRDDIYSLFNSPSLFMDSPFYAKAILRLKELCKTRGVHVIIWTEANNDRVKNTKKCMLESVLAGYDYEFYCSVGESKKAVEDADYVIDDSPFALDLYRSSKCKKFLVDKPYNKAKYNDKNVSYTGFNVIKDAGDALFQIESAVKLGCA